MKVGMSDTIQVLQIASLENRLKQPGSKWFEFGVEMEIKGKHYLIVLLIVMIWACVLFLVCSICVQIQGVKCPIMYLFVSVDSL